MSNDSLPEIISSPQVIVPVRSAWFSKINVTQWISALAVMLTLFSGGKLNLDASQQLALVSAIGIITPIITSIFRTFYTKTITPSSIKDLAVFVPK